MNNKGNKKKILMISAIISALTLEQSNILKNVYGANEESAILNTVDIPNDNKTPFTTNMKEGLTELSSKVNFLNACKIKITEISKLVIQFSELYNISQEDCLKAINDIIEDIIYDDNTIDELNQFIENGINNGIFDINQSQNNLLNIGTGNIDYINHYKNTDEGKIWKTYTDMYGIDYNFALAVVKQESNLNHYSHLPGGDDFNGCAYGISQIENTLFGSQFTAFNFETGQYETIEIVKDYPLDKENGIIYLSVLNFSDNVRIGIAKLQEKISSYNYNLAIATQAYNYGNGALDLALEAQAKESGLSKNEIINDKTNFNWLNKVKHLHLNPNDYGIEWNYGTYGDANYVRNVFQYISDPILKFITPDNETLIINANNQTTIKINHQDIENLRNAIKTIEQTKLTNESQKMLVRVKK